VSLQRLLLSLAALAAIAVFASLGRWQLGRAELKEQREEALAAALAAAPRGLADVLAAGHPGPVRVRAAAGRWLEPALLLDNQVRDRRNGVRVYRVFQPDGAPAVLVELGWLPWSPERRLPSLPELPSGGSPEGVLLPWPGQALALAPLPPRPGRGPWLLPRIEREALAAALGVALYDGVLLAGVDPAVAIEDPMPPERHRGYAVQWFALAALVAIVYGVLSWKHRRRR